MKRLFFLILTFQAIFALATAAHAERLLTPGLRVIADDAQMVSSGLRGSPIRFSCADFERAVGCPVDSVTVTALPPVSDGMLLLGNVPVSVNQVIRYKALDTLRFEPGAACRESSFRFRADEGYSIPCLLRWTDEANAAPVAGSSDEAVTCWTQRDIAAYGSLPGSDPDGDALTFEIVEYPERGYLELLSPVSGDYRYTPFDGVRGTDSFVYTVRDEWGHYAPARRVSVTVEKPAADLVLCDMEGHWAHNAALVMAADNAMDVRFANGNLYFDPDGEVTRESYLKTVMKALGAGDLPPARTVFADDGEISETASGYVERAYELGIVRGSRVDGQLCFRPKDPVTRAEAAVILNNIVGAEDSDALAVFADSSAVPAWARSSLSALTSAGVLGGVGSGQISPNSVLSRGEVAQMLFKVRRIFGE